MRRRMILVVAAFGLVTMLITGASSCDTATGGSSNSDATQVEFIVTGNGSADVTYGNDTSNYQGHVPMDATLKIAKSALYYDITAQLNGGGNIKCKVIIGDKQSVGHAVGGYNICSAQLNSDFGGGWSP